MATILNQVPLTATATTRLVAAAQGSGPAGWRLTFLGASWTGSVVLKADMGAPGQAQNLTAIPFLTESTGATNSASTPITASGVFVVQPTYTDYDLYAVYTHTSGSAVVTVSTQDGATASGDLTAANVDGSASQNTFGAAVPYTGAYAFPGALSVGGDVSVSKTISSTTPATERLTLSEVTLSGATIAITPSTNAPVIDSSSSIRADST